MVLPDRALATSYRLSIVTTCGLAAVLNGISGRISEMVKDRAKVTINQ